MTTHNTPDQLNMEGFLGGVVDDYKEGVITREQAIGGLAKCMVALNRADYDEARLWFAQGRKLTRDLISVEEAVLLLQPPPNGLTH